MIAKFNPLVLHENHAAGNIHAPIGAWLENKPSVSIGLHVLGGTKEVR